MKVKHQRFCEEYIKDNNATQAAIRAGYAPASARNQANRLMTNDDVLKNIHELKQELTEQCCVEAHVILSRLMAESVDPENTGATRVAALTTLAKYLGLLTNRVEHSGYVDSPTVIKRIAVYRDEYGEMQEHELN